MNRRIISILLFAVLLLCLCACGKDDSAVSELTFRDLSETSEDVLGTGVTSDSLSAEEVESLLTGDTFRDYDGALSLNADGSLCSVDLLQQTESKNGSYMVVRSMINLYPGARLTEHFTQTCTVHDTAVDAYRWKNGKVTWFTSEFVRPDTDVAVRATVFCDPSEGDQREDCIARLYEITEACLDPANTLTLDSVYSGADFLRRAETALVPVSPETEAALRAGAQQAMDRYRETCALDPAIPAQCVFDALLIRAVSPEGDAMLADGQMSYLPQSWVFDDVDDAARFSDGGVPAWYSGQTVLRRGDGERVECLVGEQGFRIERGADGQWQVAGTGGPVSPKWPDCADFVWVRWSV